MDWARLIPGEAPVLAASGKKLPRGVKPIEFEKTMPMPALAVEESVIFGGSRLGLFLPCPLQSRRAWKWLKSMAADCGFVALNWLILGAMQGPLRGMFPHRLWFDDTLGLPFGLIGVAVLHAALITLIGHTEGLYRVDLGSREKARILAKSAGLATAVLCLASRFQSAPGARSALWCAAGVMHFGALLFWRLLGGEENNRDWRNVLIVGNGRVGRSVAAYVEQHPESGRKICGFLDDASLVGNGAMPGVADLARLARMRFADEVILAAPRDRDLARQVLNEARRLRLDVEIVPELFGCGSVVGEIERVGGLPVICVHAERLPAAHLAVKRALDVLGASLALVALSPLFVAIFLLIKLDSNGPAFYSANRAGRKGRLFRCHKFRTMVSNADELKSILRQNNERAGPFFKIARDPRITRLGHYLRRYSLDELPQLWNVLRGEMSLVGPRPHPVDDLSGYEIEHLARLDVTPGITGLWQVTARRDPSFQRNMDLDREYIRTWSLSLDLRILLRTFLAVARGSGD